MGFSLLHSPISRTFASRASVMSAFVEDKIEGCGQAAGVAVMSRRPVVQLCCMTSWNPPCYSGGFTLP